VERGDAARAAWSGTVLGVDISEQMLERARRLTLNAGLQNITYELGDAQVHRFQPAHFDVLMVWQSSERNEWATAIPGSQRA
jgi:ubiquinone/menaquinone biosynthesis C-methylase UbiE